jgi:hypothetical protein
MPRWLKTSRVVVAVSVSRDVVADAPQMWAERNAVGLPDLEASQVAAVYRDLRRSFEGRSNEPGAADFYYGEMEMRRRSDKAGDDECRIVASAARANRQRDVGKRIRPQRSAVGTVA